MAPNQSTEVPKSAGIPELKGYTLEQDSRRGFVDTFVVPLVEVWWS